MKTNCFVENSSTKFIYFDGEVAELNSSVLDLYDKKQQEQDKEPEDIITQAKQLTLSEVPDAAQDLLEDLGKKFKKLKDLENTKTVESAQKVVREMVFEVIEEGISRYPGWGDNLQEMVDDIENEEHEAISTIRDTKRGKETVGKVLEQYEREAKVIKAGLSKNNEIKRKLGFLWKTGEVDNSSEQAIFDKFSANAVTEIKAIGEVFAEREKEASTINSETKNIISSGFKALSPENKAEFLDLVKKELASNPPLDYLSSALSSEVQAVVKGTNVLNRIEIYHEIFDLHAAELLTKSSKRVDQEIKDIADREQYIKDRTTAVLSVSNITKVRTAMSDSVANEEFKASDLGGLNDDIKLFFQSSGIKNFNDHFTLTGTRGKSLPANELNDYETFVALFDAMQTNNTKLKGMPKELKKKVLAACNWLEGISVAEKESGYSKQFVDFRQKLYDNQASFERKLGRDLKPIKTIKDLRSNTGEITNVRITIGEFNVIQSRVKTADLSDAEKQKLEKYIAELAPIVDRIKDLLDEWKKELENFDKGKAVAKKDWDIAKVEKKALEKQKKFAEDTEAAHKTRGTTGRPLNEATAAVAQKLAEIANKDTEISALETEYNEFEPSGTKAGAVTVTDSELFMAEHKPFLAHIESQLNDRKLTVVKTTTIRPDVIAANFMYNSMRQNKDLYKARFHKLQEEQFTLLKRCNRGQSLNIKMAPFTHGHDIPDTTTMSALDSFNNAIVMEKTDDAVVLIAGTRIIVVQQSNDSQKFQVLQMAAPKGFKASSDLPPDYFPENAVIVGELVKLNAK